MIDKTNAPAQPSDRARADVRPAYEPPRVTKKKAVQRATLYTGGVNPNDPTNPNNLVGGG
jgi:hypothetical protein